MDAERAERVIKGFQETMSKVNEEHAERMGYDCAKNGPNTTNCSFALFSRPEFTRAWERGKAKAEAERRGDERSR